MSTSNKRVGAELFLAHKGPIRISGTFRITGINGEDLTPKAVKDAYLCACGYTSNRPFCDGSHKKQSS